MAKNLSKSGISTTQTIEAWHVTQSIDAFTGTDAYNINLSGSLEVTGSSKLSGSVILNDITQPTVDGTEFMVLRTDGAGNLSFDYADRTQLETRTDEAVSKGDPLYITGFNLGQSRITVARADAADPNKMPSIGLAYENVGINTNTQTVCIGSLCDVNTQTAPRDFQEGDVLYVKAGGGLTNIKPTGSALIQNVGKVGRRNTINGEIVVFAVGRSNDIPNISPGYFWVGNSDSVPTAVPTSSISVTPPTLQQVTDQGSSTTTAITASIISASNTVFISASLLDPSAHVLTVDTSSGQIYYTPFEISSSGGGNAIGNPLKPLKLDGSTVTAQSTSTFDIKATQTNFKKTDGTTMAFIDHTTGDAHFGLSSVDIKGSGEITSSKQLVRNVGPGVEDLLMVLSPSLNFDNTSSAAVNVDLSGSISASNAYALKLTTPDTQTFGIKADGEVQPSKVTMTALTLTGSGGFGYVKFGNNQDQFIAGSDDQIIIEGDNTIRLQASTGISLAVPGIGNAAIPGGTNTVLTGSITLANGSAYSGSITADGYISASAFAGDGSSLTNLPASDPFPFIGDAQITGSLTISGSFSAFTLDSDNVVLGAGSGTSMEAGANSNIIVGSNTATSLTTGDFNVIIGDSAGAADTNAQKNVLIGQRAGGNSTTLDQNIFIGNGAGRYGSALQGNVGIGQSALIGTANNNGDYNVGIGWQSGLSIEDGAQNVFVGYRSAEVVTTGNYNVVIGKKSGFTLTTGANNVLVGPDAGNGVSTGNRNIAIGYSASFSGDVSDQLVIGSGSLATISASLATGDVIFANDVTVGGDLNVTAGDAQITGSLLISGSTPTITFDGGINIQQPSAATDGIRIGYNAQIYETGAPQYNIAIGHTAKDGPSSGTDYDQSIAIGRLATGGDNSVAIGGQATAAGYDYSVIIGDQATGTGNGSTVIGALSNAAASGVSIGRNADSNKQGSITIGTNTTNNQDDSIVLNATTQVVTHGTSDAFAVYMTDATTPDFQVAAGGTSTLSNSNLSGSATSTASFGTYLGDGSQLTNIPNIPTSQSIYYTADTPDQDIFNDGKIYIKLNDAATDDIQAQVLTNPSSGDVTFTWESAGGSPTSGGTALNTGDAITTLNGNFGDYDKMSLTVYAPGDTSYPYYEFLFTKGAAGTNFATRYNKWDSLP